MTPSEVRQLINLVDFLTQLVPTLPPDYPELAKWTDQLAQAQDELEMATKENRLKRRIRMLERTLASEQEELAQIPQQEVVDPRTQESLLQSIASLQLSLAETQDALDHLPPLAPKELDDALSEFRRLEDEVNTMAEALSEKKATLKFLGENTIPEMVDEDMLTRGTRLIDGTEWTWDRTYHCSLPKDKKSEAFQWLEQRGADAMLKRYITISFGSSSAASVKLFRAMVTKLLPQFEVGIKVGRAPEHLVKAIQEIIDTAELNVKMEETLELPGPTLTAFVKRETRAGRALPEFFSIFAPLRATQVVEEPSDD